MKGIVIRLSSVLKQPRKPKVPDYWPTKGVWRRYRNALSLLELMTPELIIKLSTFCGCSKIELDAIFASLTEDEMRQLSRNGAIASYGGGYFAVLDHATELIKAAVMVVESS